LIALASADEKKVPPKTPEERLEQLKRHTTRLMSDFFGSCKAAYKWEAKIHNICDRAAAAYNRNNRPCSFFDPSLEHGGPQERKRRAVEDDDLRYSSTDATGSINGITGGIRKWSLRYLAACGGQKNNAHIVNKAMKWRAKLQSKWANGC